MSVPAGLPAGRRTVNGTPRKLASAVGGLTTLLILAAVLYGVYSSNRPADNGLPYSGGSGGSGYPYATTASSPIPNPPAEPTTAEALDSVVATTIATSQASGPAEVVEAYVAAINRQDYQTAWQLGGDHLGESYAAYADSYSDTAEDDVTIEAVTGNTVVASLVAMNIDGTEQTFTGTYTVQNGVIIAFNFQQTG